MDGNVEVNNITINGTPILDLFASAEQGVKADTAVQPDDLSPYVQRSELEEGLDVDGNVEVNNITINGTPILDMFATSEQGARADTAVQPPDLSPYVQRTELEEGLAVDGNVEVNNITINDTPILDMFAEIKEQIRRHHANFVVNNEFFTDSLKKALDWVNASTAASNVILVQNDVDLDVSDMGRELPTIDKDVVINLQGHTIKSSTVFSKAGDYGWGDRLFRIQFLEGSDPEQPDVAVTIKNGKIKVKVPSTGVRTGLLYSESTKSVDLEDLVIDWDLT